MKVYIIVNRKTKEILLWTISDEKKLVERRLKGEKDLYVEKFELKQIN